MVIYSRRQVIEAFIWMTVVFVGGLLLTITLQKVFENYALGESAKNAHSAAYTIQSTVKNTTDRLVHFSEDPDMLALVPAYEKNPKDLKALHALDEVVKNFYNAAVTIRRLTMVDSQGRVISFYPPLDGKTTSDISFSDRPYFQQAKKTGLPAVSDAAIPKVSSLPTSVYIAVPIVDNGVFLGVLSGAVDLVDLQNHLQAIEANGPEFVTLADHTKHYILHPQDDLVGKPIHIDQGLQNAVEGKTGKRVGLGENGELVVQAYEPVPLLGWGVAVNQTYNTVFRQANIIIFAIFLATVLAGTWTLLMTLTIARKNGP